MLVYRHCMLLLPQASSGRVFSEGAVVASLPATFHDSTQFQTSKSVYQHGEGFCTICLTLLRYHLDVEVADLLHLVVALTVS